MTSRGAEFDERLGAEEEGGRSTSELGAAPPPRGSEGLGWEVRGSGAEPIPPPNTPECARLTFS